MQFSDGKSVMDQNDLDELTPTFYGEFFDGSLAHFLADFLVNFLWWIFFVDKIRKVKMTIVYHNKIRIFFELFFFVENRLMVIFVTNDSLRVKNPTHHPLACCPI